jgi:hypothetical protein
MITDTLDEKTVIIDIYCGISIIFFNKKLQFIT